MVALGASNTYGKGVARSEAYPAQLEKILRAKGLNVRVINAGVNGEKTASMLSRLDRAVPKGTNVVILQPGGNDRRKGGTDVTGEIRSRLGARGIKVVMIAEQCAARPAASARRPAFDARGLSHAGAVGGLASRRRDWTIVPPVGHTAA